MFTSVEGVAWNVCNQACDMFKGHVSTKLLKSVKTSEKMGPFKESHSCTSKSVCFNSKYIILDSVELRYSEFS